MRNIFSLAIAIMAIFMSASCSNDNEGSFTESETNQPTHSKAHVHLRCGTSNGVTLSHPTPHSRATLTANGAELTDLYILDYDKKSGKLLQVLHQTSTAPDFAEPDLTLDYGDHTLKVIATRSTSPILLDASSAPWEVPSNVLTPVSGAAIPTLLSSAKTSDTFGAQRDIVVSIGEAQTVNLTLERLVARMVIQSTDVFPTDCSTFELSLQEYKSFSWQTFDVIEAENNHRSSDVSVLAGTTGTTITYYMFAPADGYTTDITFTTNSNTGKPYSTITVPNVRLERNKTTTITGSFYNHQQWFSISINDAWSETGYDINI